jgi:tetratricopeptide (TPR) repeat protein
VLLILDDVSGLADKKLYLPPSDLVMLRLLMTSREPPDERIAKKLALEVLSPGAAWELLASIIGAERVAAEQKQADLLCQELGYLPLALELVGYYLDDEDYQELSLEAMCGKLAEKIKHPSLSPEEVPMGMSAIRGIQAAFDLSWDDLKPEAKHLACVLGAFASAPIHWDFVTEIYSLLQGETFSADNLKDRCLKSLRRLHLVLGVATDIYDLHPLVRDYLNEQFKRHGEHNQIQQAFCDVFVSVAGNVELSSTLTTFNQIEPHLKRAIAWRNDNNEDTQLALSLHGLAILYRSQGRYSEAEPLCLRSLEIRERQLGGDHPDIAESLNNLALLYYSQREYSKVEPLYLRSLEIREKKLGVDHPDVAESLNNLAALYRAQGKYREAEPLYLRSLKIKEQKLGADHPSVAASLKGLAELYRAQKKYSEAEPLYQRSIRILGQVHGSDHPNTVAVKENYGVLRKMMSGESA